ncbi:Helicase-related_protein [Hexamita inflata]|uniref:Helicase-related protein n=1 Tax=Hexamita inflata TaxID=28002 RepID=A0AA86PPS1_9EUKA|nr:Helicase-related protein [Hexamita inflata]
MSSPSISIELSSSSSDPPADLKSKPQPTQDLDTAFQNSESNSDNENEAEFLTIQLSELIKEVLENVKRTGKMNHEQFKTLYKTTLAILKELKKSKSELNGIKKLAKIVKELEREQNAAKIIKLLIQANEESNQMFKSTNTIVNILRDGISENGQVMRPNAQNTNEIDKEAVVESTAVNKSQHQQLNTMLGTFISQGENSNLNANNSINLSVMTNKTTIETKPKKATKLINQTVTVEKQTNAAKTDQAPKILTTNIEQEQITVVNKEEEKTQLILQELQLIEQQLQLPEAELIQQVQSILDSLQAVSNVATVQNEIKSIKQKLFDILDQYVTRYEQKLLNLQDLQITLINSGQLEQIQTVSQQVHNIMQLLMNLSKMNTNDNQLLQQVLNVRPMQVFNMWNTKEQNILNQLQGIIHQNYPLNTINSILSVANILRQCDVFVRSQTKYQGIVEQCNEILISKTNQYFNDLQAHVNNQQIDKVQNDIYLLNKDPMQIQQVSNYIQQQFGQIVNSRIQSVRQKIYVNPINLSEILQEIQWLMNIQLSDARNNVILAPAQQALLLINEIKQQLNINSVQQKMTAAIDQLDFQQAEQCKCILKQMLDSLSTIDNVQLKQLFLSDIMLLQQILQQFDYQVDQKFNDVQQRINLNIQSINQINTKFIHSLRASCQINIFYQQKYNQVIEKLTHIFIQNIEQVENLQDIQKIKLQLDYIQQNIKHLPNELIQKLERNLNQLQQVYNNRCDQLNRSKANIESSKQISDLVAMFKNHAVRQEHELMGAAKQKIQDIIISGHNKIDVDLRNNKLNSALSNVSQEWEDWMLYEKALQEVSNSCENKFQQQLYSDNIVRQITDKSVKQIVVEIIKCAQKVSVLVPASVSSNNIQQLSQSLEILQQYINVINGTTSLSQALNGDQNGTEAVVKALSALLEIFKLNTYKFNSYQNQLSELQNALELSKNARNLYEQVNKFAQSSTCTKYIPTFKDEFKQTQSYEQMVNKLETDARECQRECLSKLFNSEITQSTSISDKNKYYSSIYQLYRKLKQFKNLQYHLNLDLSSIEQDCLNHFTSQTNKLYQDIERQFSNLPSENRQIQQQFNNQVDCLRCINQQFENSNTAQVAAQLLINVDMLVLRQLGESKFQIEKQHTNEITKQLIKYKQLSYDVPSYSKQLNQGIDDILNHIFMSNDGPQRIADIGTQLSGHANQQTSMALIQDHKLFKDYSIQYRNLSTLTFTIDNVLDQSLDQKAGLNGEQRVKGLRVQTYQNNNYVDQTINTNEIITNHQLFDELYWNLVQKNLHNVEAGKLQMIQTVKKLGQTTNFNVEHKIQILAHIFAFWTLSNSSNFAQVNDQQDLKKKLLQPHPAQIVAIFSLLGIDQSNQLKNQLIQVLTGEGKSVILAVTAIVLAIMGFDVNCACYSEYLSLRDFEQFQTIFELFGVKENIDYGTFPQMCEKFINQNTNIRETTRNLILNQPLQNNNVKNHNRERILLIDEVDVFFSKEFYGNVYKPMTQVCNHQIKTLINYIWQNRKNKAILSSAKIRNTQEYQDCANSLRGFEDLLKEALGNILSDLKSFQSQEYEVVNGLIGYKDQDSVSTNIVYGYKTLFAYYQEVENRNIKDTELQNRIGLQINCGNYSYAEIPKKYKHIIGVTGTLDTLSVTEKKLLANEYKINKFSFIPSVYGSNQLNFAKDSKDFIKIQTPNDYFQAIANEITLRSQNGTVPVLVFFESSAKLDKFYKSAEFQKTRKRNRVQTLTENNSAADKESIVKNSVQPETISLFTREFGRGTDFICYDKNIDRLGGVHVIQTFFSDELSEEKQIKGRTARQGNSGSYSLVLLDQELEKYKIGQQEINQMKAKNNSYYSTIDPMRRTFIENTYPEHMRYINEILDDHNKAIELLNAILNRNITKIKMFLIEMNKSCGLEFGKSKTLILMDATGSMTHLIHKTKNTIKRMFDNAYTILRENHYDEGFNVMIAAYRNYSSGIEFILQSSGWETQPENLHRFLDTIYSRDGQDNEAIEIGLEHAVNELQNGLTQVILIGDWPPNGPQEVIAKRSYRGEDYWSKTKFSRPIHYTEHVKTLVKSKIQVHALYVADYARNEFGYIANETRGTCQYLDIDSPTGADMLTHLVTEKINWNIGGQELLDAYRAKFGKGYL